MATNYISRGEVLNLTADDTYDTGKPYRIYDFNGVALSNAVSGDEFSFQVEGIFNFELEEVSAGDAIYIDGSNNLTLTGQGNRLFGRAVTGADTTNHFYCRLLQS